MIVYVLNTKLLYFLSGTSSLATTNSYDDNTLNIKLCGSGGMFPNSEANASEHVENNVDMEITNQMDIIELVNTFFYFNRTS